MIPTLLLRLIALLTFPGIVLHEWSHKFFCDRLAIPVRKTCYFTLGNPSGYVIHSEVKNFNKMLLVTIAPFLTNTAFALAVFVLALQMPRRTGVYFGLCWLGVAIAMHSLPSVQDLHNLYLHAKQSWKHNALALLSLPALSLMKFCRFYNTVWSGLVYAILLLLLIALLLTQVKFFPNL